jgi:hypothetical protein
MVPYIAAELQQKDSIAKSSNFIIDTLESTTLIGGEAIIVCLLV